MRRGARERRHAWGPWPIGSSSQKKKKKKTCSHPLSFLLSLSQVSPDDLIYTNRLDGAGVNDVLHLTRVLAFGTRTATAVGRPTLAGAAVAAAVEEVGRDAESPVLLEAAAQGGPRRLRGHRQPITALRILDVLEGGVPVLGKDKEGGV